MGDRQEKGVDGDTEETVKKEQTVKSYNKGPDSVMTRGSEGSTRKIGEGGSRER